MLRQATDADLTQVEEGYQKQFLIPFFNLVQIRI